MPAVFRGAPTRNISMGRERQERASGKSFKKCLPFIWPDSTKQRGAGNMFSWLKYWHDQRKLLRRQMRELQLCRWERRNHPAFGSRRTRWSMVKTL
jgi:hypothetical protein